MHIAVNTLKGTSLLYSGFNIIMFVYTKQHQQHTTQEENENACQSHKLKLEKVKR